MTITPFAVKVLSALAISLSLYFFRHSYYNLFYEINVLHITFITTISVCIKELISFLFEYIGDFKLKDYIGKPNSKSSIAGRKDILYILNKDGDDGNLGNNSLKRPSTFEGEDFHKKSRLDSSDDGGNHDNGSSNKPEDSGSGTQPSGSGTQPSGSGTQPSDGKSIADDLRNYQVDSDSGSSYDSSRLNYMKLHEINKSETGQNMIRTNDAVGDSIPQFEENVATMEDPKRIRQLQLMMSALKSVQEASPDTPLAESQISTLAVKIGICESRLSELEGQNADQSQDKGKGKAVEYRISESYSENENKSKDKGKGKANE